MRSYCIFLACQRHSYSANVSLHPILFSAGLTTHATLDRERILNYKPQQQDVEGSGVRVVPTNRTSDWESGR